MCIYVREITNDEGAQLKRILRRANDSFKVKRAQVVLASAQKMRVPEIVKNFQRCFSFRNFSKVSVKCLNFSFRGKTRTLSGTKLLQT